MSSVAEDRPGARPDVLDPDRGPVHPDRVPAPDPQVHELVDRPVGVDQEVRADPRLLAQMRAVRGEVVPRGVERGPVRVVLDDHPGVRRARTCVHRSGASSSGPSVACGPRRTGSSSTRSGASRRPGPGPRPRSRPTRARPASNAATRRTARAPHATARRRSRVRSRPRSSRDSGSGGETFDPVTAARTGWNPFVRFRPAAAASSSSLALIASASHGRRSASPSATLLQVAVRRLRDHLARPSRPARCRR